MNGDVKQIQILEIRNGDSLVSCEVAANSLYKCRRSFSEPVFPYAVVIEQGERNYSAYVRDLPGCVSTGATLEEVKAEIREAIEFHLDGMREDGTPIPEPTSLAEYVEVAAGNADAKT